MKLFNKKENKGFTPKQISVEDESTIKQYLAGNIREMEKVSNITPGLNGSTTTVSFDNRWIDWEAYNTYFNNYRIGSNPVTPEQCVKSPDPPELKEELTIEVTVPSMSYGDTRSIYNDYLALNQVPYPNCCGVCILKDITIHERSMSQDLFDKFLDEIIDHLENNDKFAKILIYINKSQTCYKFFNRSERTVQTNVFTNPRTNNTLVSYEIDLSPVKLNILIENDRATLEDIDRF